MRTRLERPDEVDYQVERDNGKWSDHRARTLVTAALIAWLRPHSLIDPACGDGSIVVAADEIKSIPLVMLADISEPNITHVATTQRRTGWSFGVNEVQATLDGSDRVADVCVLTEVLEHLPDPDTILHSARSAARYLVASSPIMREGQHDTNPEHLWMFDQEGYEEMLVAARWRIEQFTFLHFNTEYDFGIWVCR